MSGATCDVCGGAGDVAVHSSSLGPMSLAYCRACDEVGAEPYLLAMNMAAVNGMTSLDAFAPWAHEVLFATVLRAGKTAEQWWADVRSTAAEMSAELEALAQ